MSCSLHGVCVCGSLNLGKYDSGILTNGTRHNDIVLPSVPQYRIGPIKLQSRLV